MIVSIKKVFKVCFTISCTIVVASMAGYWVYKYQIEDRDIGLVDIAPLDENAEIELPSVSLCLINPFQDEKLKVINSSISRQMYIEYLKGFTYDEMYEQIEYANVTLDLANYFRWGDLILENGTDKEIFPGTIKHHEVFNGFFMNVKFIKCFTLENNEEESKVFHRSYYYSKTSLEADWQEYFGSSLEIIVLVHYPGQLFLINHDDIEMHYHSFNSNETGLTIEVNVSEYEILKRRNSRKKKCLDVTKEYDKMVVDELLLRRGCHPPYVKQHGAYPMCDTREKVKNSVVHTGTPSELRILKPCQRISRIKARTKFLEQESKSYLTVGIKYPGEVKIITQSKDVDIHSLIGNIGGYLGLFLGYALVQIPEALFAILDFIRYRFLSN